MFSKFKGLFQQLIHKSTYIHHEPVNKVSIVILILVDIFVLVNVFSGLDSIAQWQLSPEEEFPCFQAYHNNQTSPKKGTIEFDANTIASLVYSTPQTPDIPTTSQQSRLGKISALCSRETQLKKEINSPERIALKSSLEKDRKILFDLDQEIKILKRQYDSTLLEKISGQKPQQSINLTTAEQIKPKIEANQLKIASRKKLILDKQTQLINQPAPKAYLKLLNNTTEYQTIKQAYESAQFWHPNKKLLLQTLFLLPLITLAYVIHTSAIRKNRALLVLLSWHLLCIFCIPLLIKFFEFIQFGNLVKIVLNGLTALFGGLLFIASYSLILVIPLVGFGLIKFLQRFIFNPQVQARSRIQKGRCINCNFKLISGDEFCAACGFDQRIECSHCRQRTYKFAKYCKHCGHALINSANLPSS